MYEIIRFTVYKHAYNKNSMIGIIIVSNSFCFAEIFNSHLRHYVPWFDLNEIVYE